MSRVGKASITIPSGVEFRLEAGSVFAKGKFGELRRSISSLVNVEVQDNVITVKPAVDSKEAQALWGTERANLSNLIKGVSQSFTKELDINGVGYRAQVQGSELVLQLGFSHEVRHAIPVGISVQCDKPTHIVVSGADRQKVGQFAAEIRNYRKPEPYKGKGIKYVNEYIVRKEGKKK